MTRRPLDQLIRDISARKENKTIEESKTDVPDKPKKKSNLKRLTDMHNYSKQLQLKKLETAQKLLESQTTVIPNPLISSSAPASFPKPGTSFAISALQTTSTKMRGKGFPRAK